ncbi:hypothetical protein L2E82_38155 [Cichorium intybus]|uniref:Uncharacterized protein n=1 Tax=Cichorium intybus TaxID=13427 RepID=A0ACB9AFL1_CICIN|nr:hypothetical protein L2E82_38155 [Cichorium intybus]
MDTEYHEHMAHDQVSGKTVLFATLTGIAIGGPLLALMGFSFLATMTLFIFTSPLLIIFSPLLLGAGFVLTAALVGFGAATVMAIGGLWALSWVFRSVKEHGFMGLETATEKLLESGEDVKDTGKEWASHLKQTVQNSPENKTANSA